jgi:uncharacterized protein YecT (DUF1311 family)
MRIALAAIAVLSTLAALSTPAGAAGWEDLLSKSYAECMGKPDGSTQSMVECIDAEVRIQDGKLNAAYKSAMGSLPRDQQDKLRASQRAWLEFRKLDCDVFYGEQTGTIARIESNQCFLRKTAERADELAAFSQN